MILKWVKRGALIVAGLLILVAIGYALTPKPSLRALAQQDPMGRSKDTVKRRLNACVGALIAWHAEKSKIVT